MLLRSLVICCYLMGAYWASYHFPSLRMVFYPTLGAFSFLFMHRVDQIKDVGRITLGAIIAVTLGSVMYSISQGTLSFFLTAIITISLIQVLKWNAAPILSVSFIPFFAHTTSIWALPAAVLVSLLGLIIFVWLIAKVEQVPVVSRWSEAFSQFLSKMMPTPTAIKKEL
ncbi:hypothetical protein P5G65_29530 [Paenibacillus chondroitinus]|uniref:HPP family protein n=1 Tax=Paenibacillus chondroitinus TaxID=59842 RepID=A0ABU6DK92_9BACL|nr:MULTISPECIES: hypothetical protein [Paenibacillus]MCY9661887.1 hypothetical protein [Paenibacillus anseongense]MEB4798054.1 hypothetical protein [Paenibacillus chondroitinus]